MPPPAISPPLNAAGWHTDSVLVQFHAVDNESGVAYVSPAVTITNEGADQLVEGMATDHAGNTATTAVLVSIDRNPPTVTGSPGEGDIVNSLRPPLVVEYSDELSGV